MQCNKTRHALKKQFDRNYDSTVDLEELRIGLQLVRKARDNTPMTVYTR